MFENKEFVSMKEVMDILSVSKPTIYKLIKENKLHPIKITKKCVRFNKSDIEDILGTKKYIFGFIVEEKDKEKAKSIFKYQTTGINIIKIYDVQQWVNDVKTTHQINYIRAKVVTDKSIDIAKLKIVKQLTKMVNDGGYIFLGTDTKFADAWKVIDVRIESNNNQEWVSIGLSSE